MRIKMSPKTQWYGMGMSSMSEQKLIDLIIVAILKCKMLLFLNL